MGWIPEPDIRVRLATSVATGASTNAGGLERTARKRAYTVYYCGTQAAPKGAVVRVVAAVTGRADIG
jgi:hypothetical protein